MPGLLTGDVEDEVIGPFTGFHFLISRVHVSVVTSSTGVTLRDFSPEGSWGESARALQSF